MVKPKAVVGYDLNENAGATSRESSPTVYLRDNGRAISAGPGRSRVEAYRESRSQPTTHPRLGAAGNDSNSFAANLENCG